ncbi:hypothetical protein KSE_45560 [Kitasatospora setae KM-6054]|uniref:Uncharacterized protein n=1 Tax=Kitasatospora setae (strain ATCC 33774 / DSM 43861 / JCM 3304 / KCC A-0304 / NBRC 14216 / KM-6054) TaxID=452652 RepID=E4NFQ7_KITSK|nr:hypothetical protein KSE_45560 [Kitasatospora setae KM-6054]
MTPRAKEPRRYGGRRPAPGVVVAAGAVRWARSAPASRQRAPVVRGAADGCADASLSDADASAADASDADGQPGAAEERCRRAIGVR